MIVGSYARPVQAFLITNYFVVCEIKIKKYSIGITFSLFCSKGMLQCLEYALFSMDHKKLPPSIDHFLATLQQHI